MTVSPPISSSFTSKDVGEATALVQQLYPVASIQETEPAFRFSQSVRGDGAVTLARFECTSPACFEVEFGGVAAFGLLRSGDYQATSGAVELDTSAPFVFQHGVGRSVSSDMDLLMVNIDVDALSIEPGARRGPRFEGARAATPELELAWSRIVRGAAEVLWDPAAFDHALVRTTVLDLVRVAAVAAFPRSGGGGRDRSMPAAVRRAQQYIPDHAHEPITIAQIAAAARLSERGLQAAFRRELQQSPLAHVQQVRLHGARAALLDADAARTTVAAIGLAWGFSHPGRFSQRYFQEFGSHPGEDLRR